MGEVEQQPLIEEAHIFGIDFLEEEELVGTTIVGDGQEVVLWWCATRSCSKKKKIANDDVREQCPHEQCSCETYTLMIWRVDAEVLLVGG